MNSDALLGTIVGGIIGFGSGIGTDIIKRWLTRPRISVSEEIIKAKFEYPRTTYSSHSEEPTEFIGIRIRIQNKGTMAAEDCKASLIVENQEYRVAWLIPKQDFTIIINPHDSEYIDLCAISSRPASSQKYIVIFTTELGYGESQDDGRRMTMSDVLEADLKVSSKNATHSIKKIWISNAPDEQGNIIHFKAQSDISQLTLKHSAKKE